MAGVPPTRGSLAHESASAATPIGSAAADQSLEAMGLDMGAHSRRRQERRQETPIDQEPI